MESNSEVDAILEDLINRITYVQPIPSGGSPSLDHRVSRRDHNFYVQTNFNILTNVWRSIAKRGSCAKKINNQSIPPANTPSNFKRPNPI
ncbi:hypothetical protein TNCV_2540281 [Trichonephila clavipes]|nr:hypothetical protein TNCV_2540281 [Trichonephila clavipes]